MLGENLDQNPLMILFLVNQIPQFLNSSHFLIFSVRQWEEEVKFERRRQGDRVGGVGWLAKRRVRDSERAKSERLKIEKELIQLNGEWL